MGKGAGKGAGKGGESQVEATSVSALPEFDNAEIASEMEPLFRITAVPSRDDTCLSRHRTHPVFPLCARRAQHDQGLVGDHRGPGASPPPPPPRLPAAPTAVLAGWCSTSLPYQVYDISRFIETHPGGKSLIRAWKGRDATAPFLAFHPVRALPSLLASGAPHPTHREQGWMARH